MGNLKTIYVSLVGEGVDVWRPTAAEEVEPGVYRILGPQSDPNERWQFAVGSLVRCMEKVFSGGQTGLVAYEHVR
jgi:hypothetical protein